MQLPYRGQGLSQGFKIHSKLCVLRALPAQQRVDGQPRAPHVFEGPGAPGPGHPRAPADLSANSFVSRLGPLADI